MMSEDIEPTLAEFSRLRRENAELNTVIRKMQDQNSRMAESWSAMIAERDAAIRAMTILASPPTPEMIEAGAKAVYGDSWDGPPVKAPGEEMKNVWRTYPAKIWPAMVAAAKGEKP